MHSDRIIIDNLWYQLCDPQSYGFGGPVRRIDTNSCPLLPATEREPVVERALYLHHRSMRMYVAITDRSWFSLQASAKGTIMR